MPTYVYETIDPLRPVRRFEVRQSMKDEPLRVDPETGEAVRRVISGGFGVHVAGSAESTRAETGRRLWPGLRLPLTWHSPGGGATGRLPGVSLGWSLDSADETPSGPQARHRTSLSALAGKVPVLQWLVKIVRSASA